MRRRHIGIVFQFFNLLEGMTVLENVVMPALIAGMKRKAAETRARDLLDLLGLARQGQGRPRRRCRAVSANAWPSPGRWPTSRRSLLADEPTGALDSEGGEEILELFRRLHAGQRPDDPARHPRPAGGRCRRPASCGCATGGSIDDGRLEEAARGSAMASE